MGLFDANLDCDVCVFSSIALKNTKTTVFSPKKSNFNTLRPTLPLRPMGSKTVPWKNAKFWIFLDKNGLIWC